VQTQAPRPHSSSHTGPHTGPLPVIVIGAGQAGLSMSWHLCRAGLAHLVLERQRPGWSWREERWDSFHLVTPNWQCRLPGFAYAGDDPDGFMSGTEVAAYVEAFARSFAPPLRTGVVVSRLRPRGRGFELETSDGTLTAAQVVVATGGYHDAVRARGAGALPGGIDELFASTYRNPQSLQPGAVLVVGSGQSGAQIAEELHAAGRIVHLAVGRAERVPRRYRGRDVVAWQELMGAYELPVDRHPLGPAVRARANPYVSGGGGGHDIDLRRLARDGLRLHGSLVGLRDGRAVFASDLAANLDRADAACAQLKAGIDSFIDGARLDAPAEDPGLDARPTPWTPEPGSEPLDLVAAGIRTVIWCTGFRPNWDWIEADVFDADGRPSHRRGVTRVGGLYFLGLPWLHRWGSGRLSGVGRDAGYLAGQITARNAIADPPLAPGAGPTQAVGC